jgi:hypothetical protein
VLGSYGEVDEGLRLLGFYVMLSGGDALHHQIQQKSRDTSPNF